MRKRSKYRGRWAATTGGPQNAFEREVARGAQAAALADRLRGASPVPDNKRLEVQNLRSLALLRAVEGHPVGEDLDVLRFTAHLVIELGIEGYGTEGKDEGAKALEALDAYRDDQPMPREHYAALSDAVELAGLQMQVLSQNDFLRIQRRAIDALLAHRNATAESAA